MDFLAHSENARGAAETVAVHLRRVSELAMDFARAFGAEEEARLAAQLHDLGKYGTLFQERLRRPSVVKGVDHWTAGAWVALMDYRAIAAALSIHGHHQGLGQSSKGELHRLDPSAVGRDGSGLRLSEPGDTEARVLLQRLKDDGFELRPPGSTMLGNSTGSDSPAASMLDVRMLFSALVDADFLATAEHFDEGKGPARPAIGNELRAAERLERLLEHLRRLSKGGAMQGVRDDLLRASLEAAKWGPGLYTMTAPTGSGKTLALLAFALAHAARQGLRRVVTVIPYLSIIEQTARVYREALGTEDAAEILEHHSMAEEGGTEQEGSDAHRLRRLLAENWAAPLVVTTSVQFFESLFARRPGACRKLHRLSGSVVLVDEVQTLPQRLLTPLLATVSRLVERFGATVVFATATQPAFGHLDEAVRKLSKGGWSPREIAGPELRLFERTRRNQVRWPESKTRLGWEEVAERLSQEQEALCIVNLRKHARSLFEAVRRREPEGVYHLSTWMCPLHRTRTLEEVRRRLAQGERCVLVSTQCVEAGVDVDFATVYRAFGPLEAVAQAAGRCNRNGRRSSGEVVVFRPEVEGAQYPDRAYEQAAAVTETQLKGAGLSGLDIHDAATFEAYYRSLYVVSDPASMNEKLLDAIQARNFEATAEEFRLIDMDAVNIAVPYEVAEWEGLCEEARNTGLTGGWIRRARPHAISVFRPRRGDRLLDYSEAVKVGRDGEARDWLLYLRAEHYSAELGLTVPEEMEFLCG